ncbi:hypothetical protein D9615_009729 [Tricholomella constricta]|uniref:Uncharacterized protein n=1 Tax=Tricholomella constricta TaxID=117010 RepID=A0A8H5GT92_9AGAR|nr:hypothetical protein D9615_009729 [Tricholomella constricta]
MNSLLNKLISKAVEMFQYQASLIMGYTALQHCLSRSRGSKTRKATGFSLHELILPIHDQIYLEGVLNFPPRRIMDYEHAKALVVRSIHAGFVGGLIAAIIYGIGCVQFFAYCRNSRDSRMFRMLIIFLWVLDTVHMALIGHAEYHYLDLFLNDPRSLAKPVWSILVQQYLIIISDTLVRSIFGRRVWLSLNSRDALWDNCSGEPAMVRNDGGILCTGSSRAGNMSIVVNIERSVVVEESGDKQAVFESSV